MKWSEKTLDKLGFVGRGKSKYRPRDAIHLYGGKYPFIQTGDVKHSNLYITKYSQTYSEEGLAQSKLWKAGTLCITIAANIAETAILAMDACFPDSIIGFIPDPEKADARFVKYLFDAVLKKRFRQFTQGATQDNLSQSKLLSLKFLFPDIKTQQKIADILSKYDDLIENNRRRIEWLEESARLLYREWFVYLRFPGHEHTPIIDGIPEGWEKKKLEKLVHINSSLLTNSFQGEVQYVEISSVTPGSINEITKYNFQDAPSRARRIVKHGDIIWSCVRPNRKSHAIIWNPTENLIVSTGFAVITPCKASTSFLYQTLTTPDFVGYLSQNARGTSYPAVTASDFANATIIYPKSSLIKAFDDVVKPTIEQINILQQQSKKLAEARDILLPRLMNGEITV